MNQSENLYDNSFLDGPQPVFKPEDQPADREFDVGIHSRYLIEAMAKFLFEEGTPKYQNLIENAGQAEKTPEGQALLSFLSFYNSSEKGTQVLVTMRQLRQYLLTVSAAEETPGYAPDQFEIIMPLVEELKNKAARLNSLLITIEGRGRKLSQLYPKLGERLGTSGAGSLRGSDIDYRKAATDLTIIEQFYQVAPNIGINKLSREIDELSTLVPAIKDGIFIIFGLQLYFSNSERMRYTESEIKRLLLPSEKERLQDSLDQTSEMYQLYVKDIERRINELLAHTKVVQKFDELLRPHLSTLRDPINPPPLDL